MAWSNNYSITIDHTKVRNSDQTNFPVLFWGKYPALRTVVNGGQATSAFDIIFASDSAGASPLAFERVLLDSTTGLCVFWVKIPTLSYTVDTTIYILVGNSAVTTDQQNKAGVWSNGWVQRAHLQGDSLDSLGSYNGTDTSVTHATTGGKIGGQTTFNGSSSQVSLGANAALSPASFTMSAWINPAALSNAYSSIISAETSGTTNGFTLMVKSTGKLALYLIINGSTFIQYDGSGLLSVPTNSWTHFTVTYDGPTKTLTGFLNGDLDKSVVGTGATYTQATGAVLVGSSLVAGRVFNGAIEEQGIANVVRSQDWIQTEVNNQSNPWSFYSTTLPGGSPSQAFVSEISMTTIAASPSSSAFFDQFGMTVISAAPASSGFLDALGMTVILSNQIFSTQQPIMQVIS